MKFYKYFCEEIQHHKSANPHSNNVFLDYKKGKELISAYSGSEMNDNFEPMFLHYLNEEIREIKKYYEKEIKQIQTQLHNLNRLASIKKVQNRYLDISHSLFINYVALGKITKKHDKHYIKNKLRDFYLLDNSASNSNSFGEKHTYFNISLDEDQILSRFNELYHKRNENKLAEYSNNLKDKTEFKRKTIKYVYNPADHEKILHMFVSTLPINKYNDRLILNQPITSIYYDNDDLMLYYDRLEKSHNSYLIRMRYYDMNDKMLFFEKKVHNETELDGTSIKKRALITNLEQIENIEANMTILDPVLDEILSNIHKNGLKPTLRVLYERTAFQDIRTGLRITLDANLRFKQSDKKYPKQISDLYDEMRNCEKFQYNVMEIKMQNDMTNDVIDQMIMKKLIIEMPKFSKYIHGCQLFYQINVKPYWTNNFSGFTQLNPSTNKTIESVVNPNENSLTDGSIVLSDSYKLLINNESLYAKWADLSLKMVVSSYGLIIVSKNLAMGMIGLIFGVLIGIYNYFNYKNERNLILRKRIKVLNEKQYANLSFFFILCYSSYIICVMMYEYNVWNILF